jgi:hypothetical protein
MAERLLIIATPKEDFEKNEEERERYRFSSDYISTREAAILVQKLLDQGIFEDGDEIEVGFEVDEETSPGSLERRGKVYSAFRTPDGDLMPLAHIGNIRFDVILDRSN